MIEDRAPLVHLCHYRSLKKHYDGESKEKRSDAKLCFIAGSAEPQDPGSANSPGGEERNLLYKVKPGTWYKRLRGIAVEDSCHLICLLCASVSISVIKHDNVPYLIQLCYRLQELIIYTKHLRQCLVHRKPYVMVCFVPTLIICFEIEHIQCILYSMKGRNTKWLFGVSFWDKVQDICGIHI